MKTVFRSIAHLVRAFRPAPATKTDTRRVPLALPVFVVNHHRSSTPTGRRVDEGKVRELLSGRVEQVPACTRPLPIDGLIAVAHGQQLKMLESWNQALGRKGMAGRTLAEPVAPYGYHNCHWCCVTT